MAGGIVKAVGCQLKTKMVIFSMLLQTAPTLPHQLKNFGSKFIDYQLHINYLSINYVVGLGTLYAQSSQIIFPQKYLKWEDNYFILQKQYVRIYKDSFGAKIT